MLSRIPPIIVILLLLAAYGFLNRLIRDPINMLLIIGLSTLLLYVVRQYFMTGRFLPQMSLTKAKKPKPKPPKSRQTTKKATTKKQFPFQVIEGNKGKSKGSENDRDSKDMYH